MRTAPHILLPLLILLLLPTLAPAQNAPADPDLDRLAQWLTGSFSSADQAAADSNFYDIRLHMSPLWTDRDDGLWLYVEQATAAALERPYRQRVYRLSRDTDTLLRSDVYTLPEPLRFAGAWNNLSLLAELNPDSLELKTGCSIFLRPDGDSAFVGATRAKDCPSELRGAAYATSEVRITRTMLMSWDRGFDSTGTQVWGAESGGYLFRKE